MIYRFGDYEIDTKLLELRHGGTVHPMDPLGFDLLVYLVENRDRVLTRDELLDALWPGKVVTDSALSSRLKSVRAAIGDTGAAQSVIKTVHGRGYRFIADLDDSHDVPSAPLPVASPDVVIPRTSAVGRDAELGKLTRWLHRSADGHREVVWICGEAGVGKTTLTRAFVDVALEQLDVLLLHGQCVNQRGVSEAYLPILEALGRAGQQDKAVVDTLRRHAPAWLAQLPSLSGDEAVPVNALPVSVTAGRMMRELSAAIDALAVDRNVILVLEDLHWSDPSTIEWLDYFARRDVNAKLLLIGTGRPEGAQQQVLGELASRGHVQSVHLKAIDEAWLSDYLYHLLDHPPAAELAALAFRRTGGFPLFIDTLVDHWREQGLIKKTDNTWSAADDGSALLDGVPESLSQLIDQQLAGLDDGERQLLETAALAGSLFAAAAIAHALDAKDEDTESRFERMARQGRIVRNAGDLHWPDGTVTATFEFRHELYREALYEQVPAARRSRLHGALGDRLEKAFGDEPGPAAGEIADHFARAHEVGRALKYFYPAALLAFNRSANRETVTILDRALALIKPLPEAPATQRIERELHLLRASAMISLEGWASANVEASYARASELGAILGLGDQSPEVYGIAAMHELRGRFKKSQALIEKLMDSTATLGLEAHELLACSLFHQGKFDESRAHADKAVESYNPQEFSAILARYGENPGVCCHGWAALDLWFLGFPDTALLRSDQALELATEHVYSLSTALTHRAFLHQFRNEPKQALAWANKTIEVAGKQGFGFRVAQAAIIGAWGRGVLTTDEVVRQQAVDSIDDALAQHAAMGAEMDAPYYLTLKADLLRLCGKVDEAIAVLDSAFAVIRDTRIFFYEAEMDRLYATLLLQRDKKAANGDARRQLEHSLQVAHQQGARMLELRTRVTCISLDDDALVPAGIDDLKLLMSSLPEAKGTPDWQAAAAMGAS